METFGHIMIRRSDTNVSFETLCALLRRLGFDERIRIIGNHTVLTGFIAFLWLLSYGDAILEN